VKYYLTILITGFALSYGSSQSIQVVNAATTIYGNSNAPCFGTHFRVLNTTNNSIMVMSNDTATSLVSGADYMGSFDACYVPQPGEPPVGFLLEANDFGTFYMTYYPNNAAGVTTVECCFYNEANPTDSACHTIRFDASITNGIQEENVDVVSTPFPNPAVNFSEIQYQFAKASKGKVMIYDAAGKMVANELWKGKSGSVSVDVSALPNGTYFYDFISESAVKQKGKLTVAH
jgi:hypothetical protein